MKFKTLLKSLLLLCSLGCAGSVWAESKELTFSLTSNPGGWPTANSTTLTNYTYTLNAVDYTFALSNVKSNSSYLMMTSTAVLGLPAIDGYKLTKVVASNSNGCSTKTNVGITSSSSAAYYILGGAAQTWSTQGSTYTYNLSGTAANTMYYLFVTSNNAQITQLALTYEAVNIIEISECKSSFTETSGMLDGDITFTSYKGGSSTNPGNYNSGIRLYQISGSNAYGGYIKLSAPTGFSITGFSITSTNEYATTVNYTVGDYTSSFDGEDYALAKNSVYFIGELDCSSVNIYNLGTGTSGRLEIASITVFYKGEGTVAINSACTDGEKYYGTYSNSHAFVVPSGLTVSEINVSDGKLEVSNYSEGSVVPKNTGVMVSATSAGNKTITFTGRTGAALGTNLLKPSGDEGITAANMHEDNTKFYRLTMHNGTSIGFWWGAADGAAFDVAANKAYLAVPNSAEAAARGFLWIDNDVTGIDSVHSSQSIVYSYYNLNGQRVTQPTKGLYIVNGKKVIVK